jgi:hypoxanthine phosphoribosyltransferase
MSEPRPQLAEALKRSALVHGNDVLDPAITRIAREITHDLDGTHPVFLTIMQGGLMFAGRLALQLELDCEFDYVHASRYRGKTSGGGLLWLARPHIPLHGRDVLLVDDILDEGHTLAGIRDWCGTQGARTVRIAVLCVKHHGRTVPGLKADYVGVEVPDRYVFGYGMDYHEQGRNLPAIYALDA